ncbi:MAG: hypothetical protein AAF368_11950, partial [Planctomycetota bacterium]
AHDADPTLLVLTTQFQTILLRASASLHGRAPLRVLAFLLAAALPFFLHALFNDDDLDRDLDSSFVGSLLRGDLSLDDFF